MPELPVIASIGTVATLLIGALLYVIRAEIQKNTKTTNKTAAEMVPNHGTSLRDAVDRIERGRREDRETYIKLIREVHDDVVYVRNRVDRHVESHNHGKA